MLRFRFVLALLATTAPPAAGQFMERLPCAGGDFYAPCALTAGRIPDLRTMYFKAGEREIRYSSVYGRDSHSRLLVIHERDGIVTGRLFLVMYSNLMGSQFAQESCLDQYWVGRQGICVRRPAAEEPDWADVLRRLDALGVAELPSYPAPPSPKTPRRCRRPSPACCRWTGSRGFFGTGRAIPSNSAILSCTGVTRFRRCLIRPLERPSETRRSCACWSARSRGTVVVRVAMTGTGNR